jgi:hypothetical protein
MISGDNDDGNDDPPEEPTPPIELPQVPPFVDFQRMGNDGN